MSVNEFVVLKKEKRKEGEANPEGNFVAEAVTGH